MSLLNATVILPFNLNADNDRIGASDQPLNNSNNYMTAWAVITVILMCIAWLANLLSLYSALVSSRVRISFYYLLANLSFLYLIVCCPLYMVFVANQLRRSNLNIPQSACNFICFFNNVLRAVVNQTYAVLAVDQLLFVRWPAEHDEHRMSVRRVKWLIVGMYALALFLELFAAIGHSASYRRIRYICVTDGFDITWAVFWYILFCAIPFLVAAFGYIGIVYFYKHRRAFPVAELSRTTQNGAGRMTFTDGHVDNGYYHREIVTRTTITVNSNAAHAVITSALVRKRFQIALVLLALTITYIVTYVIGSIMLHVPLDKQTAAWGFWLSWIMAIIHPFVWPAINAQFRQVYKDSAMDLANKSAQIGYQMRQLPRTVPNKIRAFGAFQSSVLAPPAPVSSSVTSLNNTSSTNGPKRDRNSISTPPIGFNNNGATHNVKTKLPTAQTTLVVAPVRRLTIISVGDEVGSVTPATRSRYVATNDRQYNTNPFEEDYHEPKKASKTVERTLGIQNEQIP